MLSRVHSVYGTCLQCNINGHYAQTDKMATHSGNPKHIYTNANIHSQLSYCNTLGFPLATDKIEGPCTSLCFLGICLDTLAMEAKLPDDKLLRLSKELGEWTVRKACTRRELEHLIGLLHFLHVTSFLKAVRLCAG